MADLSSSSSGTGSDTPDFFTPHRSPATPDTSDEESGSPVFSLDTVSIPLPFVPPSLSLDTKVVARQLPYSKGLPQIPHHVCRDIDLRDKGTPDDWVPRDSRLIRLTGKHPFNAEPQLSTLFAQGFITPTSLFFVRSHGAVPRIDIQSAAEWTLDIHGLCENPISLSINNLKTMFKVVTIPVTLVCAGNRRKEQNVVRKSLGFSWGPGGLSTALFTGVWLADVIKFVTPTRAAKHVIFEGVDSLPNGPYGTSQLLSWARDPLRGMMVAWGMNGLPLEPDHGFPLRLVVPGQIGGRSVKWLRRIELSGQESQHHLHFHDNKLFPMTLGPDEARAQKHWWYDPRYLIRELNLNSAIACPYHDEVVDITSGTYTIKGYAYSGGGKRITRAEVTLDDGHSWEAAEVHYIEDQFRERPQFDTVYGHLDLTEIDQCFCWCFWSLEISLEKLQSASSIAVRCMDESLAVQPRDMYWSATGMMNNWWFRIRIHQLPEGKLRFEHPAPMAMESDGWMQGMKDQGEDPAHPNFSISGEEAKPAQVVSSPPSIKMTRPDIHRKITREELAAQATAERPWFVVNGEVYDASEYLSEHPGGAQSITIVAGEDASEDFMAIHSTVAKEKLAEYHIGTLVGPETNETSIVGRDVDGSFLHAKKWKPVSLIKVQDISKDSKIYRFSLDRSDRELGLPTGQHVYVRLKRKAMKNGVEGGELVQRAYTPLSVRRDKGFIDLLVKIYYPTAEYPLGGRMTLGFAELSVGDAVELKGPIGHFVWLGNGVARLDKEERRVRQLGMVCGGSGVTPILQVLRGIFDDAGDTSTAVSVVDVNRNLEDILCKEDLDTLAANHPKRFRLRYSLTGRQVPESWSHSTGRVTTEMLAEYLPPPSPDALVCLCGPPKMERLVQDSLIRLGWDGASQIVVF